MSQHRKRNVLLLALIGVVFTGGYLAFHYSGKKEAEKPVDLPAGEVNFKGLSFDVIRIQPGEGDLQMFWKQENGERFGSFKAVKDHVQSQGDELVFATNAGIFSSDHSPGGLHIENGVKLKSLNLKEGYGNFHMKPNGAFIMGTQGASVVESSKLEEIETDTIVMATQSGPMLVIDGDIHPKFTRGSSNKYIRNGVGVTDNGDIYFAISNEVVNFHDFAAFFRDKLGCPNALYLDGSISDFYLPEIGRTSDGGDFAGIIGLVKPSGENSSPTGAESTN